MTVAVPLATAVTSPLDETVAISVFEEIQVTEASPIALPPESLTVVVRVAVSPAVMNVSESLEIVRVEADCATVTAAVPLAEPEVAVMVAVPLATEVTSPVDDTVAAVVSDDVHVTVAPDMVLPPASFTVAANVTVSPIDANVFVLGDTVTLDAA